MTISRVSLLAATSTVVLTACGSSGTSAISSSSAATSPSASASTPDTSSASVSTSSGDLSSGLLTATEIGTGFQQVADTHNDSSVAPGASAACQTLGSIVLPDVIPGASDSAKAVFAGPKGLRVHEQIARFATPEAAQAVSDSFHTSANDCATLKVVAGTQSATFQIAASAGSGGGAHDTAFIVTISSGSASETEAGELTVVGDTLIQTSVTGSDEVHAEALDKAAVAKAKQALHLS